MQSYSTVFLQTVGACRAGLLPEPHAQMPSEHSTWRAATAKGLTVSSQHYSLALPSSVLPTIAPLRPDFPDPTPSQGHMLTWPVHCPLD